MFDRAPGTACLGANFPACRKHHRRRPELPPPERKGPGAFQAQGRWPRRPGWAAWEEGAGLLVRLEGAPYPPPAPVPPPRTQPTLGVGGQGGAGPGCLPGNLGRWAGSTACWELCCTISSHASPTGSCFLQGGSSTASPSRNSFVTPGVVGTEGVPELA